MRITLGMMVENVLAGMNGAAARMQRYQTELATGRRVNRPSDDPGALTRILALRSGIARTKTYLANIAQAQEWMTASETALQRVCGVLAEAKECAQRGATDVLTPDGREALAKEVACLLDELIGLANTKHLGCYLFAGTANASAPFALTGAPPSGWTFSGNGSEIRWEIEPGADLAVNVNGEETFGVPGGPLATLIQLRDDLLAGNVERLATEDIELIDRAQNLVLGALGELGANGRRLEQARGGLEGLRLAFIETLSGYEDTDVAEAILNLQLAETSYGAAQGVAARLVRSTLVDLLR